MRHDHQPPPALFAGEPKEKAAEAGHAQAADVSGKAELSRRPQYTNHAHHIQPPARRNGPDTSRRAAAMAKPEAASRRGRVLEIIVARGSLGVTDIEIAEALNWQIPMTTPRRGELVRLGLVRDSGARRLSPWGRPSIVWVATAEGGGA
jgi:hypothetical protein